MKNYLIAYTMAIFIALGSAGCAPALTCTQQVDVWALEKKADVREIAKSFEGTKHEAPSKNWSKYSQMVVEWAKPHQLQKCKESKRNK